MAEELESLRNSFLFQTKEKIESLTESTSVSAAAAYAAAPRERERERVYYWCT